MKQAKQHTAWSWVKLAICWLVALFLMAWFALANTGPLVVLPYRDL